MSITPNALRHYDAAQIVLSDARNSIMALVQQIETLTNEVSDRDKALLVSARALDRADEYLYGLGYLTAPGTVRASIAAAVDACEEYVTTEGVTL